MRIVKGGAPYRIYSGHLVFVRLVNNAVDDFNARPIAFGEFGNVIANTNHGFQSFAVAGGICDQHTKLTQFGARDYDAFSGRWTAKDPILFAGGDLNLYGYVMSDPVNAVDIGGLFLDTLIDVGSIGYDIHQIVTKSWRGEDYSIDQMALGADLTCAVVPVLAGGGLAVRASEKALISVYKRIKLLENISNPALRKAIDKLYKVNARVGDGSSMDAYRYEKATGILLSKTGHGQKLIDSRTHFAKAIS